LHRERLARRRGTGSGARARPSSTPTGLPWSPAACTEAGRRDDLLAVLDLFEIGKALYELRYEIDNRPDWIGVPLAGLAALAGVAGHAR
jgi:hypothetical protein